MAKGDWKESRKGRTHYPWGLGYWFKSPEVGVRRSSRKGCMAPVGSAIYRSKGCKICR